MPTESKIVNACEVRADDRSGLATIVADLSLHFFEAGERDSPQIPLEELFSLCHKQYHGSGATPPLEGFLHQSKRYLAGGDLPYYVKHTHLLVTNGEEGVKKLMAAATR